MKCSVEVSVVFAVAVFAQFNSSFFVVVLCRSGYRRFLIELSCCCCFCSCWLHIVVIFVLKLNGNAIVFKRANLLQFSFIALSCRVLSSSPPRLSAALRPPLARACHVFPVNDRAEEERNAEKGEDGRREIKDRFFRHAITYCLPLICFTISLRCGLTLIDIVKKKHTHTHDRAITPKRLIIY